MSDQQIRHFLVEHIWRALRASFLLSALLVWILADGYQAIDGIVIGLATIAHLTEQFHGFICNRIERLFGWKEDFQEWE